MEDLTEIAPVQTAGSRDILHGDRVLEILLDERNRLAYVEVAQAVSTAQLRQAAGAHEAVYEQIEVPDQVKGGFLLVVNDIEHF